MAERWKPKDYTGEVIQDELERLSDREVVQKFHPQFLGYGGHQVVFSFPEHPRLVGKVDKKILASLLRYNMDAGKPLNEPPASEQKMQEGLDVQRALLKDLREVFGDHVLRQRLYLMEVPVTKDLVASIGAWDVSSTFPEGVHEALTVVAIQERAPEAATSKEAYDTATGYVERLALLPEDLENYRQMNRALIDGEGEINEVVEIFLDRLRGLSKTMETDEALREAVADFARRAMEYTETTGEMLDLVGRHNVSFFKDDDTWTYLLLDADYGKGALNVAKETLAKMAVGEETTLIEENSVLNAFNYVRTVNYLASLAGVEDRLTVFPQRVSDMSDNLYSRLNAQFKK